MTTRIIQLKSLAAGLDLTVFEAPWGNKWK